MAAVDIFIKAHDQTGAGFTSANSKVTRLGRNIQGVTKGLNPLQAGLTGLATAGAMAGFSAISGAVKGTAGALLELHTVNTDLNVGLANVQSLGVAQEALAGYRNELQGLSIQVGKDTDDLADGLYQVVSAFGETSESQQILAINAKAATAGVASTGDAIALTSAVAKGYNDTSAEMIQHAADLAFKTVELGQTTFPELARGMAAVIPLASALGVEQETLFAQFATLTGVTGSTSEVGTQLKNAYQQMLRPTKEMASALTEVATTLDDQGSLVKNDFTIAWKEAKETMFSTVRESMRLNESMVALETSGESASDAYKKLERDYAKNEKTLKDQKEAVVEYAAALGKSVVESVGANEAMLLLSGTAEGNTNTLAKMFGSVEALNAVLALSGAQADDFSIKYDKMQDVVGAADTAFDAQTKGVNSAGFALKQLSSAATVVKQDLGDTFGGIFAPVILEAAALAESAVPQVTAALEAAAPDIQAAIAGWFSGGEKTSLADLITFDLDDSVKSFVKVGDFFTFEKLTFDSFVDGEQTTIDLSGVFSFKKLSFADIVETDIDILEGLFTLEKKISADEIFEKTSYAAGLFTTEEKIDASGIFEKTTFADFISVEETISADELFGTTKWTFEDFISWEVPIALENVFGAEKYSIADLFSYETTIGFEGLFGTAKFELGDLFSAESTWNPAETIRKMTFGDILDLESTFDWTSGGLSLTKLTMGDIVDLEFDFSSLSVTKLGIGDIVDFETEFNLGSLSFTKLTLGDLLDLEFDFASGLSFVKLSLGDLFDFETEFNFGSLSFTKLKFGDLVDLEFDFGTMSFTKLEFGDIFNFSNFSWGDYLPSMFGDDFEKSGLGSPVPSAVGELAEIEVAEPSWLTTIEVNEPQWSVAPPLEPAWTVAPPVEPGWKIAPPDEPGWISKLLGWKPSFSLPAWLGGSSGAQALGGDVRSTGIYGFNELSQEAVLRDGKLFFPQGEQAFLKRGDRVIPSSDISYAPSRSNAPSAQPIALAGAGMGGNVTVNFYNTQIGSQMDLNNVARVVAQKIKAGR